MTQGRSAGYSLLEVLVAFAIMALVLAALLPGQGRLVGRSIAAQRSALAEDYAYSVLASYAVPGSATAGVQTRSYRDWRVEIAIERVDLNEVDPALYQVAVTIRQNSGAILGKAVAVIRQ